MSNWAWDRIAWFFGVPLLIGCFWTNPYITALLLTAYVASIVRDFV